MRKTRLFIYKKPELHNPNFDHVLTTNTTYYDDYWVYPTNTQFTQYGLLPYPDNVNGDYAVRQNFGIEGACTAKFAITIDGDINTFTGTCNISLGNTSIVIDPSYFSPVQFPQTLIYDFTVTAQSVDFGWDLAIQGSGDVIPATPMANWGIKKIELLSIETDNYKEVDLYDDIEVPVTYNIADVKDISKKDSNYSLTFDIPNTQSNAQLFDVLHDIASYNAVFELEKSYPAYLEVDGYRTFEGLFKLNKVVIDNDKEISYQGNLYSNFIEFVNQLGTSTLRGNENVLLDLDFSSDTVYLDESEMTNRLQGLQSGLILTLANKPFIVSGFDNWGLDWEGNDVKTEQPFISDANYPNKKIHPWFFDQLCPALRVKDIWDKIFEGTNYTYVSDFLNNTAKNDTGFDFTSLIYPHTGTNTTLGDGNNHCLVTLENPTAPNAYILYLQGDNVPFLSSLLTNYAATTQIPRIPSLRYSLDDNFGGSNLNWWIFTAPVDGWYKVQCNMLLQLCTQMRAQTSGYGTTIVPYGDTVTCTDTSKTYSITAQLYVEHSILPINRTIIADGSKVEELKNSYYQHTPDNQNYFDQNIYGETEVKGEETVYIRAGERIIFEVGFSVPARIDDPAITNLYEWNNYYVFPYQFQLFLKNNLLVGQNIIDIQQVGYFAIGNTFNPTCILNPKTKKIDFINDIIKKFNLYIEDVGGKYDAATNTYYNEHTFRIEPRNLYYNLNNVVRNWTDKVDVDSVEFKRIDDYLYKQLIFNDKANEDINIKDYNSYEYPEGEFGEKIIVGEFNTKDEEKVEITTNIGQTMVIPVNKQAKFIEFPSMVSFTDGQPKDKELGDKMLFVSKCDFTDEVTNNMLYNGEAIGLYRRQFTWNGQVPYDYTLLTPYTVITSYNWSGHLNHPYGTDTADLNYGWASWYMENLNFQWATDNNAYNRFYKNMVDNYNDVNARMLKCNIFLPPSEITSLQLSDTIIINNVAYHINKINQWKNNNKAVQVELVKLIDSNSSIQIMPFKNIQQTPPQQRSSETTTRHLLTLTKKELVDKINEEEKTITDLKKIISNLDERVKKLENS